MSLPLPPEVDSKRGGFIVGSSHEALADVDAREAIIKKVQQLDPSIQGSLSESFEVLDFTFVPKGVEEKYTTMTRLSNAIEADDDAIQQLLLLVAFTGKSKSPYSLVELIISSGSATVGMVRPITSYSTPISKQASERPRVHLPKACDRCLRRV